MKTINIILLTFSEVVGKLIILNMINIYLHANIDLLFSCMEAALTTGGK